MKKTHLIAAALAVSVPGAAIADSYNVTIAAGHPPVFRWVRMISEHFIPTVTAQMEEAGHSITFSEQYGGALAKVGEDLEAVEAGLADIGPRSALFAPAQRAVHNIPAYPAFLCRGVREMPGFRAGPGAAAAQTARP